MKLWFINRVMVLGCKAPQLRFSGRRGLLSLCTPPVPRTPYPNPAMPGHAVPCHAVPCQSRRAVPCHAGSGTRSEYGPWIKWVM